MYFMILSKKFRMHTMQTFTSIQKSGLFRNELIPFYYSVIAAHHKCGNKDAIGKAKRILQYMEESKDSSIEPDVVTYTTFLNIVSRK